MKNCRLCLIIRYFIASVFFLIIISLTMEENLHYLSFVTPWNAVYLIIFLGVIFFYGSYIFILKQKISDLLKILQKVFFSGTNLP